MHVFSNDGEKRVGQAEKEVTQAGSSQWPDSRASLEEAASLMNGDRHTVLMEAAERKNKRWKTHLGDADNSKSSDPVDESSTCVIRSLTKKEIIDSLPSGTFTSAQKRSCATLEKAASSMNVDCHAVLEDVAERKKQKRETDLDESVRNIDTLLDDDNNTFLQCVSEECERDRISKFIDATGSAAVATSTCAVCAGLYFSKEIKQVTISYL
jgi:hypothetical protein